MEAYYYNSSTILKYLRKVLNEIRKEYVDSGIRAGFIMKRFASKYGIKESVAAKLVLLCILKDIGCFYQDGVIPKDNPVLVAASSYAFLKHCSPLGDAAKPLLFYNAKYMPDLENDDYYYGLLITLINQVVLYVFQEYTLEEIEDMLKKDKSGRFNPNQIKKLIKLLKDEEDILEKLNQKNSLFVHEACSFVQHAEYSDEELLRYIDMTNYAFEFHNHETLAHTITTAIIAKELSKLSRLSESQINCIYLAALVHDIGKIRVPVSILCHPGRLEGEAFKEMRRHVEYTKEILEGSFSYKICEIASNHHERLDGTGYPRGLRSIDLSIGDKIIAVSDVASALYCKRSYKDSFSEDQIIDILESDAKNNKLDQRIVRHFVDNIEDIMAIAKEKESEVLQRYENVKNEYNTLSTSPQLKKFFEDDELEESQEELANEDYDDIYEEKANEGLEEYNDPNLEDSEEYEETEEYEEAESEEMEEYEDVDLEESEDTELEWNEETEESENIDEYEEAESEEMEEYEDVDSEESEDTELEWNEETEEYEEAESEEMEEYEDVDLEESKDTELEDSEKYEESGYGYYDRYEDDSNIERDSDYNSFDEE